MKPFFLLVLLACIALASAQSHTFTATGDHFMLDGKPFQIRSGEMHFSRVPRPYWRDRLRKMKAMGLNTVATYMFWNVLEPEPGQFAFTGNNDAAAFMKAAKAEGMYVLLRPGPYACAEWEWGGYPYWLANIPDLRVRSRDPRFLEACGRYLKEVAAQLTPYQVSKGGPILMVQVENEYGSYGSDKDYLGFIRDTLKGAGFNVPLYTVDGPSDSMLSGGTLPDVFAGVNLGGDPEDGFKQLAKYKQNQPQFCGEFYPGWFDQWGQGHSQVPLPDGLKDFDWMMSRGISFNLYMVHGGWTPGFMNGANVDGGNYHPQTNSYYDDTCIDDAGRPTAKFYAYQDIIKKYLPAGQLLSELPEAQPVITIPSVRFTECAPLMQNLPKPVLSDRPLTFEQLHQPYGFVLYEATLEAGDGELELKDLQDRAMILGTNNVFDRRLHQTSVHLKNPWGEVGLPGDPKVGLVPSNPSPVEILVENLGRVNYGKEILTERKGISGGVFWKGAEVAAPLAWQNYSLPMSALTGIKFTKQLQPGPAWYRARFDLEKPGDTFLDMRQLTKGVVWVNGHNLGRYWRIGAQQTTYVPGCWLKKGRNDLVVFELENGVGKNVSGVQNPIWEDHKP